MNTEEDEAMTIYTWESM